MIWCWAERDVVVAESLEFRLYVRNVPVSGEPRTGQGGVVAVLANSLTVLALTV